VQFAGIIGALLARDVSFRVIDYILGLPYAIREAGLFAGILLLVVLGLITDWTIRLIVVNAKLSGRTSYIR
jgi:hypothetical protein